MATLIVLAGLPGGGKSSVARCLSEEIRAIWLRVDSIEQAIRDSGVVRGSLDDAGYRAGYAVAQDNLRLGRDVVADSVNPWMLTRNAWRDSGVCAGARVIEVEITCSDPEEHRRRIENRVIDVPNLAAPDWLAVVGRDYQAWDRSPLVIDTCRRSVAECVAIIRTAL